MLVFLFFASCHFSHCLHFGVALLTGSFSCENVKSEHLFRTEARLQARHLADLVDSAQWMSRMSPLCQGWVQRHNIDKKMITSSEAETCLLSWPGKEKETKR